MNIHKWFHDDSKEKCDAYTTWIEEMIDEGAEETDWEALSRARDARERAIWCVRKRISTNSSTSITFLSSSSSFIFLRGHRRVLY